MKAAIVLTFLAGWVLCGAAAAAEKAAFVYDRARTPIYLGQTRQASASGTAVELRRELSAAVDEILDGPWLPLYSDSSAAQAGGVGAAEWCFNRPGEYFLVLCRAAPCMTAAQKAKTRELLRGLLKKCPPTRQVYLANQAGKPRSIRRAPAPQYPWLAAAETQRLLFAEGYAVWAYAQAFDAWDEIRPSFDDLRKLRGQLEGRGDFAPAYKSEHAGPLTAADAQDPAYRFTVYESLLAGFQDNYGYHGASQARARMQKDKPVYFYVKTLSTLVGYYRLARRLGQAEEAQWARETFDAVAALGVGQRSAPYLWSDPDLSPEVGRVIRETAGPWLDDLAKTSNVGNLPATDWSQKIVAGKRDYAVMDPYTWYHAWGGQGEGIRPRTVLGAFLANAYLLGAPAEKVVQTLDIPWCKADLYYAVKLTVAIEAAEKTAWTPVK